MKMRIKAREAESGKRLKAREEDTGTDHLLPLFSLSYVEKGFCVKDCEKSEQAAVVLALRYISTMTWRELKNASRRGMGYENIYSINKNRPEIANNKQLIAFRVGKLFRLVGFRERQTFFILWVDPKGQVYSH